MALTKTQETIYGISVTHWVIESVNINNKFRYAEISLLGFVSEEAYFEGKSPLETIKIKSNINDGFDNVFSKQALTKSGHTDIYALAYKYVKENTREFKGALDC